MTVWANRHIYSTLTVGDTSNYTYVGPDGTLRVYGTGTAYEDLRIDGLTARSGVVTPTDTVGFRGDNNFQVRHFVHTQADEVQFTVQMPHSWKEGTAIYPHVHFAPTAAGAASNAAQFILSYFVANVDVQFPTPASTYTMTKTWSGDKSWYHYIAGNAAPITMSGITLSSIIKCRLYRDNTVGDNFGAALSFLYFDIHYEADGFGSAQEYIK